MDLFGNKNQYDANVIYKAAIEEELEWRKDKSNECDIIVVERMLKEVQDLGYRYKYLVDLTNRDNTDKELLNIVLRYINCFVDVGISSELVGVVGKKGNLAATEVILKKYTDLSIDDKYNYAGFYDNALYRIKDKRYLLNYLEFLKDPKIAITLPLTMIMLGKWNVEEAKPYFFDYLSSDVFYHNKVTSDLVFISIEALSYYNDLDGAILNALESKLNSTDKDILVSTKKAIKRLEKTRKEKTGDGTMSSDSDN